MKYLLDANTYIEAKNFYYGMDICPDYWQWLDWQFEQGIVASVDMIGRELGRVTMNWQIGQGQDLSTLSITMTQQPSPFSSRY